MAQITMIFADKTNGHTLLTKPVPEQARYEIYRCCFDHNPEKPEESLYAIDGKSYMIHEVCYQSKDSSLRCKVTCRGSQSSYTDCE